MKKFIMLVAFMGMLVYSGTALAEIVPTVKNGSSRSRVSEVQSALNKCSNSTLIVDGLFGPNTAKAVRAYQMTIGLSPVGYVGPKTAQSLNSCYYNSNPILNTNVNNEPLCPNGMTIASNCTTPIISNAPLCPNGMTIISNCTLPGNVVLCPNGNTMMSNCQLPYTGNVNTNGNNGNGFNTSTEGIISSITKLGSYNNTKLYEGEQDIPVLGIEALARDGDQKVEGLIVSFKNNGSSNKKVNRYIDEVSIWLNGNEIGRKKALDYSTESSDTFTYRFTGMNGMIKKDEKAQIVVSVSAVGAIDSADATNDAWNVSLGSSVSAAGDGNFISTLSANGRYRDFGIDSTGSVFTSAIDFVEAGGINSSQRFRISSASNNPNARMLQVSDTSDTYDKLLLSFDARAEASGMLVQRLPVALQVNSGGVGVAPHLSAIIKNVSLYADGTKLTTESIPAGSSAGTIVFGQYTKLGYALSKDSTVRFEVRADLHDINSGTGNSDSEFDNGDSIIATIGATELSNARIDLNNYYQDSVQNRTGSVIGGEQTLRATGIQATLGTVTSEAVTNGSGEVLSRTITIPVTLEALDTTTFVSQSAENALVPTGTNAIGFIFKDASGSTKSITHSATFVSQNAPVQSGSYRVDSGTVRNFTLTIVLNGNSGDNLNQYRIQVTGVNSFTDAGLTTGQTVQTLDPANSYQTPYYTLNLN